MARKSDLSLSGKKMLCLLHISDECVEWVLGSLIILRYYISICLSCTIVIQEAILVVACD